MGYSNPESSPRLLSFNGYFTTEHPTVWKAGVQNVTDVKLLLYFCGRNTLYWEWGGWKLHHQGGEL